MSRTMKTHVAFFFILFFFACKTSARQGDELNKLQKSKREGKTIDAWSSELVSAVESKVLRQDGLKEKDKVDKLPGQPHVKFDQYAGYVTVDEEVGRALFYYFVEAEGSKGSSKPLLLWLNGGPGCSSFGYGAMEELGPFRVKSDGKTLYRNRYTWNKVANVLFLESPAGVGFSYSNRTSDYGVSGDQKTAQDSYVFLRNWLERFPEYKKRDFYIAGESYAGHYVPQLAHTILRHNQMAKKTIINLKGIAIGNAVINDETDNMGMYDYFWTHALSSDETNEAIHKYCNFSNRLTRRSDECDAALTQADYDLGSLDIYNIYAPLCASTNLTKVPKAASLLRFDPCTESYVEAYLNLPEVQKALHANVTKLNHSWTGCSDVLTTWGDSPSTILPLLQEFMANGIRVLVYSGDTDGRVPVSSTRYSLKKLQLPIKTPWQAWYLNEEVGGYSVVYKGNLTFATVRGAGHEVPSYQPLRAFVLAKYFLEGKPLPISWNF